MTDPDYIEEARFWQNLGGICYGFARDNANLIETLFYQQMAANFSAVARAVLEIE